VTVFEIGATMRDGTVLRADVYRPMGEGPWPVLLVRTPYGKRDPDVLARLDPYAAAGRGYLVVIQDCRGRYRSGGDWVPLAHESTDGYDTIAWAARLPGADGRVGTYGPSYLGHVQWAALAARPPELCAAVPGFTWSDPHDGLLTRGGVDELGLVTHWTSTLGVNVLERRYANDPAERRRRLDALEGATTIAALRRLGLPVPVANGPLRAPVGVPTLTVAGWFDAFLQGSLDNHVRAREGGAPAGLIVGPWAHSVDDGGALLTQELDWLDRILKRNEVEAAPPVLVFVNGWRTFPSWPPPSVDVPWYLHAGGGLSLDPSTPDSPPDGYHHDPRDPVPTCGGALLMAPEFPAGAYDQRPIEERADVLVYTSAPLRVPLEVIGRVTVHLVASSTAASADWVARLCDVDTGGVSRNLTDGIVRSQRATEHVIDLWSTAHVFRPGHRVRLQLASSCFPRWDRNDTGARQTVYHDAARPSRLVLPVRSPDRADRRPAELVGGRGR
jgi:predicted acyl esterase